MPLKRAVWDFFPLKDSWNCRINTTGSQKLSLHCTTAVVNGSSKILNFFYHLHLEKQLLLHIRSCEIQWSKVMQVIVHSSRKPNARTSTWEDFKGTVYVEISGSSGKGRNSQSSNYFSMSKPNYPRKEMWGTPGNIPRTWSLHGVISLSPKSFHKGRLGRWAIPAICKPELPHWKMHLDVARGPGSSGTSVKGLDLRWHLQSITVEVSAWNSQAAGWQTDTQLCSGSAGEKPVTCCCGDEEDSISIKRLCHVLGMTLLSCR